MNHLTQEELDQLKKIDSPTVANAIEAFELRDAIEGYASLELRCMLPDLPPVVGYAVTCTVDSTSPAKGRPANRLYDLYRAVEAAPKPSIVVMHDVGQNRLRSCHAGDVMSTFFSTLGAAGLVTDGGVRDLAGIQQRAPGFQIFAAGTVVSHGVPTIVEVGVIVSIFGMTIRPGDLLHGDANGLVSIPHSIANKVAAQAEKVWARESDIVSQVKAPDFQLAKLAAKLGWH